MGCENIKLPDGSTAIICSRGQRKKKCSVCGKMNATLLCDFPIIKTDKTCDALLCQVCAVRVKLIGDCCPAHFAQMEMEMNNGK